MKKFIVFSREELELMLNHDAIIDLRMSDGELLCFTTKEGFEKYKDDRERETL